MAEETEEGFAFEVGDHIIKWTGDYIFAGIVMTRWVKRNGRTRRYVVEDDAGISMIMNEDQMEPDPSWRKE